MHVTLVPLVWMVAGSCKNSSDVTAAQPKVAFSPTLDNYRHLLPFAIWLMSAFFNQIPPSIEKSALVAGCGRWQAFWHVILPLSKAGLVTTAVLCLVFAWNDYAFATVFAGPSSQTLPIAASQLVTQSGIDWGQLTAIGTIVVLPMVVAGLAVRRYLVTGLTLGAVTGE